MKDLECKYINDCCHFDKLLFSKPEVYNSTNKGCPILWKKRKKDMHREIVDTRFSESYNYE